MVVGFGIATAVLSIVDGDENSLQGLGATLLVAFVAITIGAILFLGVRVFRRMKE